MILILKYIICSVLITNHVTVVMEVCPAVNLEPLR